MKTVSPFLIQTANFISVAGHPLLTVSLFTIYVTFQQLPLRNAALLSGLLIGGVILPVSVHNYRKVKRGQYTNFDVSDQRERHHFYHTVIALLALVTGLFFATGQPRPFCYGMVSMLLLVVSSYLVNFFIKASLHTSISFFMAWAILLVDPAFGVGMAVFTLFIAASRVLLKRHTIPEIVAGAIIGVGIGAGFYGRVA